ncbi:MAG: hypothetical protein HY815_06630 [Candidatus Riflebacteria bacterium]|nr:hypothetical protein [Candidatus Riflebacteria bacterium]
MFVILFEKVPGVEASRQQIRRHVQHVRALDSQGQLVLCGPFTDHPGGMIVLRARDKAEAVRIAEADPFVSEGTRTFEVRTWELASAENDFMDPGPGDGDEPPPP